MNSTVQDPKPSIHRHSLIATLAVSGSRVAGLLREIIFAFFFGAGPALDAFIAAFRIPNLLRDLLAEGALSSAFVTVFSKKSAKVGDKAAWDLANRVFLFAGILLGSLTLLGILFSPSIVSFIASGFQGEKFQLTVTLNRILFPFIFFVSLAAISMGCLNSKGKFALPQSASTFFNITSIAVGLTFAYLFSPLTIKAPFLASSPPLPWFEVSRAILGMAIGTLVGGLVQWLIQMPSLFKLGFRFKPTFPLMDKDLKNVLRLTGPAILGGAAVQINVLINTNFASHLADGSISWLQFAFRLMQFPIGVFGVAIASATLPAISRHNALNDTVTFKKTLTDSTRLLFFLCIPSALGLILLAEPILALIYQHGQFTSYDTLQAAYALKAYSVGLVAYALIKVYQPAFLIFEDAKTPMIISLLSIAVNFIINWLLVFVFHFAHWGLALGTSVVALWNGLMLIFLFRKKTLGIWTSSLFKELGKITLAALASTGFGWIVYRGLTFWIRNENFLTQLMLVFIPIVTTALLYYLICNRLRIQELIYLRTWLERKRGIKK